MNNIEILEEFIEQYNASYPEEKECVAIYPGQIEAIENLIQENKELKERINKSIEFINDDDTFFDDGESWQNVLHIEQILKGE